MGLDTTGPDCSVALCRNAAVLFHRSERISRGHAERLGPMVETAIEQADISLDEIERLAVCTGPGSFTGLRVALSFAKGFALPRSLPVIGVDALHVAAGSVPDPEETSCFYRDIKRGQVCFGAFRNGRLLETLKTMTLEEAEALAKTIGAPLQSVETVDATALAKMAPQLDMADFPPKALYSRAPDAKLPGGVAPP